MPINMLAMPKVLAIVNKPLATVTLDDVRNLNDIMGFNLSESTVQALHGAVTDPANTQQHLLAAVGGFMERKDPATVLTHAVQCPECLAVFNPSE